MNIANKLRLCIAMVGLFSILMFNTGYILATECDTLFEPCSNDLGEIVLPIMNDTEEELITNYNTQFGTLKIQANTLFLGQEGASVTTERVIIEVLKNTKQNRVFYEVFEDYQIEEGWINVDLGGVEDNPFNIGEILDADINWLKITVIDAEGVNPPIIITMNAMANALFANIARETPTGNLFPSFQNNHDKFAIVNENDNTFEYILSLIHI